MEDRQIITLFHARSDEAVAALSQKYGPQCRTVARGILADPRDAEECVNDTWMQAWNSIPPAQPAHLGAYICRVARNLALNRLKHDSRKKRGGELVTICAELHECIPGGEDVQAAADDTVLQCIHTFLENRSPRDRALFLRRYFYMEPVGDLAKQFRMTPSAVSTCLGRMRTQLKIELEKEGILL